MDFKKTLALKQEVLDSLREEGPPTAPIVGLHSVVERSTSKRIAVGISHSSDAGYQLELRAQGAGAFKLANAVKALIEKEGGGSVNIGLLKSVRIPLSDDVGQSGFEPLCRKLPSLCLGASIGRADIGSGSLGAFLEHDEGYPVILSCNHVLARFRPTNSGIAIYHPGLSDKDPLTGDDMIAKLENTLVISTVRSNVADAAIAKLLDGVRLDGNKVPTGCNFLFEGREIGGPKSLANIARRQSIYKVGRTTGFTEGVTSAVSLDNVKIQVPSEPTLHEITFDDVVEVASDQHRFSLPGDSGSLAFAEMGAELFAVGLVFAGGTISSKGRARNVTYVCSLGGILNGFRNVSWPNGG